MQEANVENLRAFLESADLKAWARGEIDLSLYHPDITYEDTILPDDVGETYRGHEGIVRAAERWLEPFEEPTGHVQKIVGTGDQLVSIHRFHARARHTGIEVEGVYANLWWFRDGKVIHYKSFLDPAEALKDASLEQ
jgi:ketosteroid isomerase-like protein